MGDDLTERAGRYWVLFYQPLPEAGERLSFGLVFEDAPGHARVEYDPAFAKVVKLYPDADIAGLTFILDNLGADVASAARVEEALGSYGPQIAVSSARRIATPVSRPTTDMLM